MKKLAEDQQYHELYDAIRVAGKEYDAECETEDTGAYGMLENDSKTSIAYRIYTALRKAGLEIAKS